MASESRPDSFGAAGVKRKDGRGLQDACLLPRTTVVRRPAPWRGAEAACAASQGSMSIPWRAGSSGRTGQWHPAATAPGGGEQASSGCAGPGCPDPRFFGWRDDNRPARGTRHRVNPQWGDAQPPASAGGTLSPSAACADRAACALRCASSCKRRAMRSSTPRDVG